MSRKAQFPPPIYPRNPKPGQRTFARVWQDGKITDVVLGPAGSPEAGAAYARLVATMAANGNRLPNQRLSQSVAVVDVAARWTLEEAPRYDPAGREPPQFARALAVLVRLFGPLPAAEFRVGELEQLRTAMASGSWMTEAEKLQAINGTPVGNGLVRKSPVGWARNTVNRMIVRIRTVWRWAEKVDLVPGGSFEHLRTLKRLSATDRRVRQTPRRTGCTEEQYEAARDASPPAIAAMLELQWLAGMRSQEVRLIRPCDVDHTGEVWLYRPRDKTAHLDDGYQRIVPLGPACQAVLAPWLARAAAEQYVFRPRKRAKEPCYTDSVYARLVARACARAKIKPFSPYQLRHAAKKRLTREYGLDVARSVLGQRSLGVANSYDSQLDLDQAVKAMRDVG